MTRRLALITGASAGIGAALARSFAANGYDVALTARRGDRLNALAEEIRLKHEVETLVIEADLSRPGACADLLGEIEKQGRHVDALANNAGYGLPGTYAETEWPDQSAFLQVMVTAVCELSHRVLPGMVERGFGRILNVASLAGLTPGGSGHTLYGAAKSFLVRFSQSLHMENASKGIHVTALCPGFTYSEFHDVNGARDLVSASVPPWLWLGADEVAAAGLEAVEANRPICVTGAPNKAIAVLAKLLPDEWIMALMASQSHRIRKS